jgi:hypothetical protein
MVRSPRFDVPPSFCLPPVDLCSDVSRYGMIRGWILLSALLIAFVLLMEMLNLSGAWPWVAPEIVYVQVSDAGNRAGWMQKAQGMRGKAQ